MRWPLNTRHPPTTLDSMNILNMPKSGMPRRMHVAHGMEGYKQVHGYCVDVLERAWLHMECS